MINQCIVWSSLEGLEEIEPPRPHKDFIPRWWKDAPTFLDEGLKKANVRSCPQFADYWANGFVLPLWCDLEVEVTEETVHYQSPNELFRFEVHGNEQMKDYLPDHAKIDFKGVLKPKCPWHIKTPKGYSIMQLPVYYEFNPVLTTLSGVMRTDVFHQLQPQLVFTKIGKYSFKRGMPLAYYFPFKREAFELKVVPRNKELIKLENKSVVSIMTKFIGAYRDLIRRS